ncbi:MAG: class I SAM-dependent methyltransferase [Methylohalobius sp. ZOD2]|nr:methyltransferase domain-containing protein [Methylothermaceae bacterium]
MDRDTLIHIDFPQDMPKEKSFPIHGWIASQSDIHRLGIEADPQIELNFTKRPDVVEAYPFFACVRGFQGVIDQQAIVKNAITFRVHSNQGVFSRSIILGETTLPEMAPPESRPITAHTKREKLALIAPYLICPQCGARDIHTESHCAQCGERYFHTDERFNFLTEEFRKHFEVKDTDNVSQNSYDHIALSIIDKYRDGLILDCGSGKRDVDYRNVINFEIVDYPSTHVVGINEKLPFQDETFDAVFSLAVLEHVKDPFRCAKEIARVLKKGGTLYCVVPFLQPLHGYPNHFYNMTSQGLINLFKEDIEILNRDVPLSGVPIWTLSWILNSWSDGLSGSTRKDFLNMRVKDLIGNPIDYLEKDFVKNLSKEKNHELASTTMIMGRK